MDVVTLCNPYCASVIHVVHQSLFRSDRDPGHFSDRARSQKLEIANVVGQSEDSVETLHDRVFLSAAAEVDTSYKLVAKVPLVLLAVAVESLRTLDCSVEQIEALDFL